MSETYSEGRVSNGELSPLTNGIDISADDLADLARAVLARDCVLLFKANGASMLPLISDGDVIQVNSAGSDEIRLGDIIFAKDPSGKVRIHRVIRVIGRGQQKDSAVFITKGDNSMFPDEPFPPEQVLGRVELVEKGGKTIDLTKRDYCWAAYLLGGAERLRLAASRRVTTKRSSLVFRASRNFLTIPCWMLKQYLVLRRSRG